MNKAFFWINCFWINCAVTPIVMGASYFGMELLKDRDKQQWGNPSFYLFYAAMVVVFLSGQLLIRWFFRRRHAKLSAMLIDPRSPYARPQTGSVSWEEINRN